MWFTNSCLHEKQEGNYCTNCGYDLYKHKNMPCTNCGNYIKPDDNFCGKCGKSKYFYQYPTEELDVFKAWSDVLKQIYKEKPTYKFTL